MILGKLYATAATCEAILIGQQTERDKTCPHPKLIPNILHINIMGSSLYEAEGRRYLGFSRPGKGAEAVRRGSFRPPRVECFNCEAAKETIARKFCKEKIKAP